MVCSSDSFLSLWEKKDLKEKTTSKEERFALASSFSALYLACWLWTCGKAEHHGKQVMEGCCLPHGNQEGKEERMKVLASRDAFQWHTLLTPPSSTISQ